MKNLSKCFLKVYQTVQETESALRIFWKKLINMNSPLEVGIFY